MKNHEHMFQDETFTRLNVKIFTGVPARVESDLQEFINSVPMTIEDIMQSESSDNGEFGITITIFYYSENPAIFILKSTTAKDLADRIYDQIEAEYGITIEDILELAYPRKVKNKKPQTPGGE